MKFRLSSGFMEEIALRDNKQHTGIDLAMPEGTELRAIGEGVIDKVFDGSDAIGKGLSIQLEDGSRAIYGHMSDVDVKVGDEVNIGDLLGESGNTGHSSGPHLHFGLKAEDGSLVDPTPVAENLSNMSGDWSFDPVSLFEIQGSLTKIFSAGIKNTIREKTEASLTNMIWGALDALREVVIDLTYSISLVGTGVMIILYVAGYDKGAKWAGILPVAHILIKVALGGYWY